MGLNYFVIDGVSSKEFDVIISGAGTFSAPQRSVEFVSVPGRNGDLVFDNGRYENVTVSYEAGTANTPKYLDRFRAWLLSHAGEYVRIEDTYHPGEYRMGAVINGLVPTMEAMLRIAKFTISFNCKPQRWLKSGEKSIVITDSETIRNDTYFDAAPLIRVYGEGTITIGSDTITVTRHSLDYIDIDCDIGDAYCGSTNANGYITLSGTEYPVLSPGDTAVSVNGNISSIVLTPRWWTL